VLASLSPLPLHSYATGSFAGLYEPQSGAYDSTLAQQLIAKPGYATTVPADNGPFTVQSFVPNNTLVLARNPRFFSNFFHQPALDRVTFLTVNPQWPQGLSRSTAVDTLVADYRRGTVELVEGLGPLDLSQLRGIATTQVITSPVLQWIEIGFNQRPEAPNAQTSGGVSLFTDLSVRKAFVEAFDRCAAVRAQLGIISCSDPNLFTDELSTPPAPDYDSTVKLPAYNPADAARLMDQAGYPVVDGIRRNKDGHTPLQLTIHVSAGGADAPLIGQRLQQDYARNLKIGVTLVSPPDFFSGPAPTIAYTGTFDIGLYSDTGTPDPAVTAAITSLAGTDAADIPSAGNAFAGPNFLGIIDPLTVKQAQLGTITFDAAQRANVYRALQRHFAQQFYVEPVLVTADITLTKPTLCNFKKWPQSGANTWNMADWYIAPSCP
jgi:peptide/nickel transport system substrate-binding protein